MTVISPQQLVVPVHPVFFSTTDSELADILAILPLSGRAVIFMDHHLPESTRSNFLSLFAQQGIETCAYSLAGGETAKQWSVALACWHFLQSHNIGKEDKIFAMGGGALLDLIGFVGSVYLRGLDTILIPTSLLAQVDAAIGGKNALNFEGRKNVLGTLTFPSAVWVHAPFLTTQAPAQFQEGLVEILKILLVRAPEGEMWVQKEAQWEELVRKEEKILCEAIKLAIQLKLNVVAEEERNPGVRDCLNFGHTLGHALEAYYASSAVPLSHGSAVCLGIRWILAVSEHLEYLKTPERRAIERALVELNALKVPLEAPNWKEVVRWMQQDKKNPNFQRIRLILLEGWGKWRFQDFTPDEILSLLIQFGTPLWVRKECP